jgi:23S rRNA (pseudouridine1915-N3)-methyltransferase
MKEIKIVCVGKIKESYFTKGIEDAVKKIRRFCPVVLRECQDEPTPEGASPAMERIIKDKEGQRILSCIDREDYVVALCIEGKHYSTDQWHRHLSRIKNKTAASLVFVIGGSLGLSDEVIRRANEKLSFSAMTFPHQMMRVILLEALEEWINR